MQILSFLAYYMFGSSNSYSVYCFHGCRWNTDILQFHVVKFNQVPFLLDLSRFKIPSSATYSFSNTQSVHLSRSPYSVSGFMYSVLNLSFLVRHRKIKDPARNR